MASVTDDEANVVHARKIDPCLDMFPLLRQDNVLGEVAECALRISVSGR